MENKLTKWERIVDLYKDGFQTMPSYARSLWIIILLKLFIMFFVFKLFFFRDTLKNKYATTEERADHVIEQITISTQN